MKEHTQILIIDDNRMILQATSRLLRTAGYDTVEALTGEDGWQAAQQKPDIILLDVMLPDISGFDLCRRFKAAPEFDQCSIILMSGVKNDTESQADGLEGGADDFIARPISNRELLARIKILVRLKKTEHKLNVALHEKDVLLREVHHRVKNNLQAISSLLWLQAEKVTDPKQLESFHDMQSRIQAMAMIHEMLYQADNFIQINMQDYVPLLLSYVENSYGMSREGMTLDLKIDHLALGLDTALPCALLIHELVSNSLKHAFPNGEHGEIAIHLHQRDDTYELIVSDTGIGLPEHLDFRTSETMGFTLLTCWIAQIQAEVELTRTRGTCFMFRFQELQYA